MTQYQLTLERDSLPWLCGENEQLAHLLEEVLNQVLEAQVVEQVQVGRMSARWSDARIATGTSRGSSPHGLAP
jgi:hypothetical protein